MKKPKNRIKQLRNEHIPKLTQENLANEMGVTKLTISRWENDESQIKPDKVQRLADFFDVSVSYLLGYSNINLNNITHVGQGYFGTDLNLIEKDRIEYMEKLTKDIDLYQNLYSNLTEDDLKGGIIKVANFFDSNVTHYEELLDIYRYTLSKIELLLFRSLTELHVMQEGKIVNILSTSKSNIKKKNQ